MFQEYSIRIRGRAIEIFTTVTNLIAETSTYKKGFTQQYFEPVIPMFCEKFVQCLRQPNGPTIDCGLKTDIIKAINCLISKLPKFVINFLPEMLPPVWETLTQSAKIYQDEVVNGDGDVNDKEVDSDGKRLFSKFFSAVEKKDNRTSQFALIHHFQFLLNFQILI